MVSRRLARGQLHTGGVGVVLAAVVVVLLAGCGGTSNKVVADTGTTFAAAGDPALARALSFRYQRLGTFGQMDQTVTVTSTADVPMTITASLVALDANGNRLPGVRVSSVFGTERGSRVLMPGDNIDAMVLSGSGTAKVRGVGVHDIDAHAVAGVRPAPEPVTARVVNVVEYTVATRFAGSGVLVENPNDHALKIGVVLIIWSRPGKGESQQAERVLNVGQVRVAAHGKREVKPSAADAATIEKFGMKNAESVKAYVAP